MDFSFLTQMLGWSPALADAAGMFVFLALELTLLFLLISFLVGLIQTKLSSQRIQKILGGQSGRGYLHAALLGSVTPFCSCSTIPMLSGLLKAKAGFGPTLTFLFTSPLLNPIIIAMFFATFGAKVTLTYIGIAAAVSVFASWLLQRMGFERYVRELDTPSGCAASGCGQSAPVSWRSRLLSVWKDTWQQFRQVLPYLLLGIGIGAFSYGFIPSEQIARVAGGDNLLAIPLAAVIGIPLYIRAEAVIPLAGVFAAKGMGLGAIMALVIGSAGASLTEVILLRSLFRTPMIIAFLVVILSMAILAGVLFSVVL